MQTELDERKQKILSLIKSKLFYILAGIVIFVGAFIRTRNLPLLKDKFLLALDPYVFFRYTKYIVEHGSLMAKDMMRYVPLGYNPKETGALLSYIIAYLYKFISIIIPISFEKFNILYPVIAFILAMIVFFLLVKKLFNIKIAALATAFLCVLPGFLYRTTAGFSEKEPIGIFLIFLTFYFYISAFHFKSLKKAIIFGLTAGILSGLLRLIWGGVELIFFVIPIFALILFILNKFGKKEFYIYISWFTVLITSMLIKGHTLSGLISSFTTLFATFVFFAFLIDYLIFNLNIFQLKSKLENKFPIKITSLFLSLLLGVIASSIIFSPSFLIGMVSEIFEKLIHPMGTSRFVLTVAEAHQPYFVNWEQEFYHFFYIFFLGSILLFYNFVKPLGKLNKISLTALFTLFISAFIFSRYSPTSIFNGENFISNFLYIGSLIIFIIIIFLSIIYLFFKNKEVYNKLKELNINYIFIFIWFLLTVVSARGAMRLFFVFAPVTAILGAYFIIKVFYYIKKLNINMPYNKILAGVFLILVLATPINGSLFSLAKISHNNVKGTGPSFNNQWETAMSWVKQNTQKDAVFAHWWDYGYWVQTMGERATILDGGNAITYWNYLMGRHVLTGHSPEEALEFLKSHNATHLLIIADEIGKYPAYSSIGSDLNYDRYSYLPPFSASPQDTIETRNETLYLYKGQFVLDEEFIYNNQIFSSGSSIIAGFILPVQYVSQSEITINQPTAIVIANSGQRIDIPLECVYFNEGEVNYEKPGIKGCLQLVPSYNMNTKQVNHVSRAIYISEKVRKTLFTQMFLFNKQWEGFELVYEDSSGWPLMYVENIGRLIGPLKIWKINYPEGTKTNPDYLELNYPSSELQKSR